MDNTIDKLLEAIKDKMSKKQVIAIVAIITLYMLGAHPGYLTGVAIVAIVMQTYLDKGKEKSNENANSNDGGLPA